MSEWRKYNKNRAKLFYDIKTRNGNYFHNCFPTSVPLGFRKPDGIVIFAENVEFVRTSTCMGGCACKK